MNKCPANEPVLQVLVGFSRGKRGSLMEQASCQLSPAVDNVLWNEFHTLERNWSVTFCKQRTNRLNIWALLHLCRKADFCTPALHGLVGSSRNVVWVQRGMWAPDFTWVISRAATGSRVQCMSCWHIPAVFSLSQGKQYTWEVLLLHRVMSFRSQTTSLRWKMTGRSIVFRLVSTLTPLWPPLLSLQLYCWNHPLFIPKQPLGLWRQELRLSS